ncbi:MAG: hypothetical protein MZV70_06635 [Desulfobacterales bacterium]|nr:hypothetical protein [Desulfobacterales bacterium]
MGGRAKVVATGGMAHILAEQTAGHRGGRPDADAGGPALASIRAEPVGKEAQMDTRIPILDGRHIVLGVTGGIAAYKSADLASRLVKAGAVVDVVMTAAATEFVRPLTFQALTHRPVAPRDVRAAAGDRDRPRVARPAGGADDHRPGDRQHAGQAGRTAWPTTCSPRRRWPAAGPSCSPRPWSPACGTTRPRLPTCRSCAAAAMHVVGPESGQARLGRLRQRAHVRARRHPGRGAAGCSAAAGRWRGRTVVVTAGGTREAIDPVRFVGNRSSGKMGVALAAAARDRGRRRDADPRPRRRGACRTAAGRSPVESAERDAGRPCSRSAAGADALLMAAAVADYRPIAAAAAQDQEGRRGPAPGAWPHRRTSSPRWPSSDRPLAAARARSSALPPRPATCSPTPATSSRARRLDLIVANDVAAAGSGFEVDTNRVTLLDRLRRDARTLPLMSKAAVAEAHHGPPRRPPAPALTLGPIAIPAAPSAASRRLPAAPIDYRP